VNGSEVIVRECGSRNGTFVNRVRVKAQSGVRNREPLRFGKVEALVEIEFPGNDQSTAISALDADRKRLRDVKHLKTAKTSFPVVFTPKEDVQERVITATVIAPSPSEQVAPTVVSDDGTLDAESFRSGIPWIRIATGFIVVGVLIYSLWRK
jgi:hypothetical protein